MLSIWHLLVHPKNLYMWVIISIKRLEKSYASKISVFRRAERTSPAALKAAVQLESASNVKLNVHSVEKLLGQEVSKSAPWTNSLLSAPLYFVDDKAVRAWELRPALCPKIVTNKWQTGVWWTRQCDGFDAPRRQRRRWPATSLVWKRLRKLVTFDGIEHSSLLSFHIISSYLLFFCRLLLSSRA